MAALDQDGAARLELADRSEHGAGFDERPVFQQYRGQNAGDGRLDFMGLHVGVDFNQRLVEGDRITGAFEPPPDRRLGSGIRHHWRSYFRHHVVGL